MKEVAKRNPWSFVPTLYFAEGVPYILINTVSVIMYKKMGVDNAHIAFWTSLLYLPWVIKMFWSPLVEAYSTKRNWVIYMQFAMMCALGLVALTINSPMFFVASLVAFVVGAFISATHDIAADGFYLFALNKSQQAYFVGVRTTFYRLAMIFGSGLLVYIAGSIELATGNIAASWSIAMGISSILFGLLFLFHKFILPCPPEDKPKTKDELKTTKVPFVEIFSLYFTQKKIWAILIFILVYRFGEAMLIKLASPFLLDPRNVGGLGMTTRDVGLVYGTIGIIALICGAIVGGWIISKFTLKKCIWPMAFILNLPHIAYLYLSYALPSKILVIGSLIALEQFGFGFGFTAYTVYLMYISRGQYKTSFFAISTGIMALGMMIPGFVSGAIQEAVGYQTFFWIVLIMGIPSILTLFLIPLPEEEENVEIVAGH